MCIGIASLYSHYCHKKDVEFKFDSVFRDFLVYLVTLLYLFIICIDH